MKLVPFKHAHAHDLLQYAELDWLHNWAFSGAYALAMLMLKVSEGTLHLPVSSMLDYQIFWVHDSLHCHESWNKFSRMATEQLWTEVSAIGRLRVTVSNWVTGCGFVMFRPQAVYAPLVPLKLIAVESQCRPWGVPTTPGSIWDVIFLSCFHLFKCKSYINHKTCDQIQVCVPMLVRLWCWDILSLLPNFRPVSYPWHHWLPRCCHHSSWLVLPITTRDCVQICDKHLYVKHFSSHFWTPLFVLACAGSFAALSVTQVLSASSSLGTWIPLLLRREISLRHLVPASASIFDTDGVMLQVRTGAMR